MKQNGQWLSHVRTWSKTALGEVEAERRAGVLVDDHAPLEAPATDLQLDPRLVGLELVADHVAHRLTVHADELVAREETRVGGW